MADPWSIADELRLSIVMGLRRGLRRLRGMRQALNEDQQHIVAAAIAEQLRLSNWDIRPGRPGEGHAGLAGEAGRRDEGGTAAAGAVGPATPSTCKSD